MINDFDKQIQEIEQSLIVAAERTLHKAGELGVKEARSTTLFKHGNAFDQAIVFTPEGSYQGEVVSGKDIFLEEGNGAKGTEIPFTPHVVFIEAIQDFRYVDHTVAHGPLPYLSNAANVVEEQIEHLFLEELDKILR